MVAFKNGASVITRDELSYLYEDAGWVAYTKDLDKLFRAVNNSELVITACSKDKLVGLVRTISDRETIVYTQNILDLKNYKQQKIGSTLIEMILEKSRRIKQVVLLTDAQDKASCSFYKSLDFKSCDDGTLVSFIKM